MTTLDFNDYQRRADITSSLHKTESITHRLTMAGMGLACEAGEYGMEVNHVIEKALNDPFELRGFTDWRDLIKELGDIMWYVAEAATSLGIHLDDLAAKHLIVGRKGELNRQPDRWLEWSLRTHTMVGHCGFFGDYIKKVAFHDHPLDKAKAIELLSFAFQQVREMVLRLDIDMVEVLAANLIKLEKRYGKAFTAEASLNRTA